MTLSGTKESSASLTISFSKLNGTYTYTINTVSGYTLSQSSRTIAVNGKNATQAIKFTSSTPKKTLPVLSLLEFYGIIGAVIVLAAIGVAAIILRSRI